MKTEEDEAFDELAKKQGDWGGGFQAKRQMAADKLQEPVAWMHTMIDVVIGHRPADLNRHPERWKPLYTTPPLPAQDESDLLTIAYQSGYHDGKKAALAGREWNFCERCGKRTRDMTTIHTCTPPQEKNDE
jgi:hypothetical protein